MSRLSVLVVLTTVAIGVNIAITMAINAPKVFSVHDGDTIKVVDANNVKTTIRLACIDAPELAQAPYGATSTAILKDLISPGTPVSLKSSGTDQHSRTIAEVFSKSKNINLEMVRQGQAFAYWQYMKPCDGVAYGKAEQEAKELGRGVWAVDLQKPWDYRKQKRNY